MSITDKIAKAFRRVRELATLHPTAIYERHNPVTEVETLSYVKGHVYETITDPKKGVTETPLTGQGCIWGQALIHAGFEPREINEDCTITALLDQLQGTFTPLDPDSPRQRLFYWARAVQAHQDKGDRWETSRNKADEDFYPTDGPHSFEDDLQAVFGSGAKTEVQTS